MSLWRWVSGLTAFGLLVAAIAVALVISFMGEPSPQLIATLSFLLAAFLLWIFWMPPRPQPDRYTLAWTVIAVVLVIGGVAVMVAP
jgi:hypothetical protein